MKRRVRLHAGSDLFLRLPKTKDDTKQITIPQGPGPGGGGAVRRGSGGAPPPPQLSLPELSSTREGKKRLGLSKKKIKIKYSEATRAARINKIKNKIK